MLDMVTLPEQFNAAEFRTIEDRHEYAIPFLYAERM